MNIKNTFLSLTKFVYPHGCESMMEDFLPSGYLKDGYGNYYLKVGESRTMFTCHLDNACSKFVKVTHIIDKNFIKTNGKSILGADDKAGMTILLWMIENKIPGLYYFFIGEEVGCLGSRSCSIGSDFLEYDRCVSFDRRGYNSIITHQSRDRCCSDKFAKELSSQLSLNGLRFRPDNTGFSTDSASFINKIPECTNISVGYFKEHTTSEYQDISFLVNLSKSVLLVEWEKLPTDRIVNSREIEKSDNYDFNEFSLEEWSEEIDVMINDDLYSIRASIGRISYEKNLIFNWLKSSGCVPSFMDVSWDGNRCNVIMDDDRIEYLASRGDLSYLIEEISSIPLSDFKIVERLS